MIIRLNLSSIGSYRYSPAATAALILTGGSGTTVGLIQRHICGDVSAQRAREGVQFREIGRTDQDRQLLSMYSGINSEGADGNVSDSIERTIQSIRFFTPQEAILACQTDQRPGNDPALQSELTPRDFHIKSQLIHIGNIISISPVTAEARFNILKQCDNQAVMRFVKPWLPNEFIKHYLRLRTKSGLVKARIWYCRFDKLGIKRNLDTYYLLLSHYLENNMHAEVIDVLRDVLHDGVPGSIFFRDLLKRKSDLLDQFNEIFRCERHLIDERLDNWLREEVKFALIHLKPQMEADISPSDIQSTVPHNDVKIRENDASGMRDSTIAGPGLRGGARNRANNVPGARGSTTADSGKLSRMDKDQDGIERIAKIFELLGKYDTESSWKQQVLLEAFSHMAAEDRGCNISGKMQSLCVIPKLLRNLMYNWSKVITEAINAEISRFELDDNPNRDAVIILLFTLKYIKVQDIARISIRGLLSLISNSIYRSSFDKDHDIRIRYTLAAQNIGAEFKHTMRVYSILNSHSGLGLGVKRALSKISSHGLISDGRTRRRLAEMDELVNSRGEPAFSWTPLVVLKVGILLLDIMIENLKLGGDLSHCGDDVEDSILLGHTVAKENNGKKTYGYISVNKRIISMMDSSPIIHPVNLPMLTKPLPWTSIDNGGYISGNKILMLNPSFESLSALKASYETGALDTLLKAIDVLSSVPWTINKKVLDVAEHFYNIDDYKIFASAGKVQPAEADDIFVNDELCDSVDSYDYSTISASKLRRETARKLAENVRSIQSNYSKRSGAGYKINMAKGLAGRTFYYSYNIDFRGRAYPTSLYLSHASDDLSRGLLLFGEKKKLGKRGLYWLKVQIASLAGCGRLSFDERVKFTEDNMHNIIDSAKAPIRGDKWWAQFDNRWQVLACCIELYKAIESKDPESYETGIHVHKDGTCNGVQHYAALSRDATLAEMVNLTDSNRPNDIYSYLLDGLIRRIKADIENKDPLAIMAIHFAERKLIKQTVMTIPYGVTMYGAVSQIRDKISEGDIKSLMSKLNNPLISKNTPSFYHFRLPQYIARVAFDAIDETYGPAVLMQKWLMLCAEKVTKSVTLDYLTTKEFKMMKLMQKLGYLPPSPPEEADEIRKLKHEIEISKNHKMNTTDPRTSASRHSESDGVSSSDNFCRGKLEVQDDMSGVFPPEDELGASMTTSISAELPKNDGRNDKVKGKIHSKSVSELKSHIMDIPGSNRIERKNSALINNAVRWTSPIGLPIVQPYRDIKDSDRIVVRSKRQSVIVKLPSACSISPIIPRMQITSFPPNFIHSLDATHMMLAAISCYEQGICFVSIHDSYWTHPSTVDILDKVITRSFVKLHSADNLENLRTEILLKFRNRYYQENITVRNPEHIKMLRSTTSGLRRSKPDVSGSDTLNIRVYSPIRIDPPPRSSSLDIKKVLDSKYFFN